MRAPSHRLLLAALLVLLAAPRAFADGTLFLGANTSPANRQVRGFSVGLSAVVVGLEAEYANTTDDLQSLAPSLTTASGNLLLQPPFPAFGIQPYITGGAGYARETLGTHDDTSFALNTGGGVKIDLVGPVRLRVDYRFFRLGSGALNPSAHRVYVGVNLKF